MTPYIHLIRLRLVEVEAQCTRLIEISWILTFRVSTPYIHLIRLRRVEVEAQSTRLIRGQLDLDLQSEPTLHSSDQVEAGLG